MKTPRQPLVRRLQTPLWVVQAGFFLFGGAGWLLAPDLCLRLLVAEPVENDAVRELAVDAIALLGPFSIGMGLLTLHAQMRAGAWLRRAYAQRYAAFLLLWTGVFVYNYAVSPSGLAGFDAASVGLFDRYQSSGLLFLGAGIFFVLVDALIGMLPDARAQDEVSRGSADTKPSALWAVWMLQGLWYLCLGLFLLLFPPVYLGLVSGIPLLEGGLGARWVPLGPLVWLTYDATYGVAVDQVRMVAPYYVGMGLMSFVAVRVHRWWIWQQFTWLFLAWQGLWVLTALLVYDPATYAWPYMALAFPTLCFMLLNGRFALLWDPRFESESLLQPRGWLGMDWLAGATMALQSIQTNRRASHLVGIGCDGRFEASPDPDLPALDAFAPGRRYDVLARFANLTEVDDAALDVRGAAFRLVDPETGRPQLDLLMNTGAFCPAGNLVEFSKFVISKWLPERVKARALARDRRAFEGGVAGLRRAPDSYAALRYYSQLVRHWIDAEGVTYLVRFRLVPADPDVVESGLPSDEDCRSMHRRSRLPTESRPPNYLRKELHERLRWGEVPLLLQVQLHTPSPGDGTTWYDPSIEWPEDTHPWRDLGTLTIDDPLPDEATEELRFDPGCLPRGVAVPVSFSPLDPRSMAYSEVRVVAALQVLRLWMYRLRGLPGARP